MNKEQILSCVDHTLLRPNATFNDIKVLCDDAILFKTASVCIAPSFVRDAAKYTGKHIPICTVIGFPNGYNTTKTKIKEAEDALINGASEIDMVINLGWCSEHSWTKIQSEISEIKQVCGNNILKVIVETCLWNDDEKIELCRIVSNSGADFIKTSTGFSFKGATRDDIALFAKHVEPHVKIKAAGGIQSFDDAEEFINLGASRLGTSRLIKLMKDNT